VVKKIYLNEFDYCCGAAIITNPENEQEGKCDCWDCQEGYKCYDPRTIKDCIAVARDEEYAIILTGVKQKDRTTRKKLLDAGFKDLYRTKSYIIMIKQPRRRY
jgi:hypothetical protein